jgi:hypothetical protein
MNAIRYARSRVIRATALLHLVLVAVFGQVSPVPYAPDSDGPGPTFASRAVTISFPGKYSCVQKVDFSSLKPLRKGRYREDQDGIHYSEQVDKVYYLPDSSSANTKAALVLYSWFSVGGSSSQGERAQVFSIVGGTLRSTQEITWDTHFQAGQPTVAFNPSTYMLVIRSAHYIPGDAHCCVSAMDAVTYRWDGSLFVQADIKTELSEYGKDAGKKLGH